MDKLELNFFNMLEANSKFIGSPQRFKSCGVLSSSEVRFLRLIGENTGLSISDISSNLKISKSAASQFIEKLVQKKYVKRVADTKDRRQVKNILTNLGEEIFNEHLECRNILINKFKTAMLNKNINEEQMVESLKIIEEVISDHNEYLEKVK